MENSEFILLIDQLASYARNVGSDDVEQFWNSIAAKVAGDATSRSASFGKEAIYAFQLSGPAAYDCFKNELAGRTREDRDKIIDLTLTGLVGSEQRGAVSTDQASLVRRVLKQVRDEYDAYDIKDNKGDR